MRVEKLIGLEKRDIQRFRYNYNLFMEILREFGEERAEEVVSFSERSNEGFVKVIRPRNKAIQLHILQHGGLNGVEIYSVLPVGSFPVVIESANSNKRIIFGDNLKLILKAISSLTVVEDLARFSLIKYARDPATKNRIIRNAKRTTSRGFAGNVR